MRTIRPLAASEIETLLGWAAAEGWNPGLADAAAFGAADPDGFLGAFVGGEFVAGISAAAYGDDFGFIGLYICRLDQRGKGHGRAVWDAGMARLAGRTIGLDGVPEQQANYASMGFARSHETIRMTGTLRAPGPPDDVVAVTSDLLPQVREIDRRCFPAARDSFLDHWLAPPRQVLAVVRAGELCGYGVVRRCIEGHKIGPLFADSLATAEGLLRSLGSVAGGPIAIDVPAAQVGLLAALASAGFLPGFSTARMYRGPAPPIAAEMVFGVTTLELG